jgi:hypothetical protein
VGHRRRSAGRGVFIVQVGKVKKILAANHWLLTKKSAANQRENRRIIFKVLFVFIREIRGYLRI